MTRMLEGLTALDLTDIKGQFAGRILADLGVRVIKVEPPSGDHVRSLGPFKDDSTGRNSSLRFAFLNGGKESITLDIETADGRDLLLALVEHVDVVIESYSPGYLESLGVGYEAMRERNQGLVVASITGFGQYGPHAGFRSPDIVGAAMGGLMFISGDRSLAPVCPPETQAYYYASVFATYGVLLALFDREATGRGQYVDASIQESIATQEHTIREAVFDGVAIGRNGSQHKHAAPANIFPCQDGHVFLFILGARDWGRFLDLWDDHPPELDASELRPPHRRRAEVAMINPMVEEFTRRYPKRELMTLLQSHGIPCLPVNSPREFLDEEQTRQRDFLGQVTSPDLGEHLAPRFPALFDGLRPPAAGPAPGPGDQNPDVFGDLLGLSAADLELLSAQGIV